MRQMYIDFHVLQTVPPSCVNRDDTGSPKMAVYGGVARASVSSQAWKHAMREMFHELFKEEQLGYRTLYVRDILAEQIKSLDGGISKPEKMAEEILKEAKLKTVKDGKTSALFFISNREIKALAQLAVQCPNKEERGKESERIFKDMPSVDIALFGRMAAENPSLNYDASAQVAHSISTHAVSNEYDYFTAVDECQPEDSSGAGHINTTEFNSSTLYRYANINVSELAENLRDRRDVCDAVRGFAQAFLMSMPTGKQNSFANRTLPDMAYITIRHDQPVNMAGAFEKPVASRLGGYAEESEKRLVSYVNDVYRTFAEKPYRAFGIGTLEELKTVAEVMPAKMVFEELEKAASTFYQDDWEGK